MTSNLPPQTRTLLTRIVRSQAPWRARSVSPGDLSGLQQLVAGGLITLDAGVYRPTEAGRAAVGQPVPA